MNLGHWMAILSVFFVAVISPGPDFLAVLRTSLARGRTAGYSVGAGIGAGTAVWIAFTLLGIVSLINAHPQASLVVRIGGAVFLLGYGITIWRSLWRTRRKPAAPQPSAPPRSTAVSGGANAATDPGAPPHETNAPTRPRISKWWPGFRLGFLTNTVGNPKAVVFFSSLFATIVPPTITLGESLVLATIMVCGAMAWFTVVATVATANTFTRGYQRLHQPIDALLGTLFVVLALALFPWEVLG